MASFRQLISTFSLFNTKTAGYFFLSLLIFGVVALWYYFKMRIVALYIDVTLLCLDQYKMTALRYAQTYAEEREKP